MKTAGNILEKIEKINPFKVPAGYFENFSENIMSQLPEKDDQSPMSANKTPQVVSLWVRVRPWVYMAAIFAGITLMFNIFVQRSHSTKIFSENINNIPITEIDEFNSYYQEKMAYVSYLDALYGDDDIL